MHTKVSPVGVFILAAGLAAPALADPAPSHPPKPTCQSAKPAGSVWRPNAPKAAKCDKAKAGIAGTGFGTGVGAGTGVTVSNAALATNAAYIGFGVLAATTLFVVVDRHDQKPVSR